MILRWIKVSAMEQVAKWQGETLSLYYKPSDSRWHLDVGKVKVRQRWTSVRAAENAIDTHLCRIISQESTAHARQGAPSSARIVHVQ